MGLLDDPQGECGLSLMTDSDWAGDRTRHSRSGFVAFLAGAALSWRSSLQTIVAASSTEAETIAAAIADQEIRWLRSILHYLILRKPPATPLYIDNNGAAEIIRASSLNRRSRHIEIKHLLVRDSVRNENIDIRRVDSNKNTADIFTKVLPVARHSECVRELGLSRL